MRVALCVDNRHRAGLACVRLSSTGEAMRPLRAPEHDTGSSRAESFHTTHWSVVLRAGQEASPQAAEALETLCRTYWYPLYAFIRRKGYDADEAQDLTQAFFVHLLEKNYFAHADRAKGKFRSFLLSGLNYFLANDRRRGQAVKRGGGQVLGHDAWDGGGGGPSPAPALSRTAARKYCPHRRHSGRGGRRDPLAVRRGRMRVETE